jgi:hypothetical protein
MAQKHFNQYERELKSSPEVIKPNSSKHQKKVVRHRLIVTLYGKECLQYFPPIVINSDSAKQWDILLNCVIVSRGDNNRTCQNSKTSENIAILWNYEALQSQVLVSYAFPESIHRLGPFL